MARSMTQAYNDDEEHHTQCSDGTVIIVTAAMTENNTQSNLKGRSE
jgi:hypothetical protein